MPPGVNLDAEQRWYKGQWKITIDKMTRYRKEMEEAREMLEQVDQMDYN